MTTRALGSGNRKATASAPALLSADPLAGTQVSKSLVAKIFPESVRANSRLPSLENHTCRTGPVAGAAKDSSTADVPILRQSGRVCAPAESKASEAKLHT